MTEQKLICVASSQWCAMRLQCGIHHDNVPDKTAYDHYLVLARKPVLRRWNCNHFEEVENVS